MGSVADFERGLWQDDRKTRLGFPHEAGHRRIIPYSDVQAEVGQIGFTEEETPPDDAPVIGQTWLYVNKRGGPDRRFSNNRELPIVRYGSPSLKSPSGLNELFYVFNPVPVEPVTLALNSLRGLATTTKQAAVVRRQAQT